MLWVHGIVLAVVFGFYRAYEKSKSQGLKQGSAFFPVLGMALLLRFVLVLLAGESGGVPERLMEILGDMAASLFLFHRAEKKLGGSSAFWLIFCWLFNPVLIGNCVLGNRAQDWIMLLWLGICLFCYIAREDGRFFDCYTAFTGCFFYWNMSERYLKNTQSSSYVKIWMAVSGLCALAALLYFIRALLVPESESFQGEAPKASRQRLSFAWWDFGIILGICVVYGGVAFSNLGILEAPVTEYSIREGDSILLDFGQDPGADTLNWYLKDSGYKKVLLETRESSTEPWSAGQEISMDRVFCWGSCSVDISGRYMRLTNISGDMAIGELVLQDGEGRILLPENAQEMPELFDETEIFPEELDYQSGSYFDESYYTRTAYEFLKGTKTYETTHPPLGKTLIALGVKWFGTCPFGFRFMGVVFGILMLPFLYLLGRELTGSRLLGGFASFLFAFDFMHFTQTRIATIDVFITFFTIVMYYFMYQYSRMSFYDTPLVKTFVPLGACGIAFGLGISCKWTGFYAGIGLAAVFFCTLYTRYREYVYASKNPQGSSHGISHEYIRSHFREAAGKTILFCVIFFLAVPFVIYLLSYLPFSDGTDRGLFARMWENQKYMLHYHTGLEGEHPYASPWYQWPVMIRPVFYYSRILEGSMRQGISAFGNPLVWWAGIPACLYMIYLWLKKQDGNAGFLCIGYAACYLPWCMVSRYTFAYHYFPSVPFVACMIMYSFAQWRKPLGERKFLVLVGVYSVAVILLFGLFYPVISGRPVSMDYVVNVLRWMDSWVFVLK